MASSYGGLRAVIASLCLVVGCNAVPEQGVAKRVAALTPGPSFTLQLPPQVTSGGSGFTASTALTLGDRVQVKQPTASAFAGIVNLGSGQSSIGIEAKTGDIWSVGPVQLGDRSIVNGFLKTAGTFSPGSNITVTGAIQQSQPLTPPTLATVTVQFQNSASAIAVGNDATRTLSPGDYAEVTLGSRSTLALSTGDYRFDSLVTQLPSTLRLTTSAGSVRVFVRNTLNWNSTVTAAAGDPTKLLLAYVGNTAITINTSFTGTLLSPNAPVALPTGSSPHVGAFFAKSLTVQPDVVLTARSFQQPCEGVIVDDGNACTADACDPDTGTVSHLAVANGTACSDGSACTQTDSCQVGVCVGTNSVVCTAQDQCHNAGVCSPSTGQCSNPSKVDGTTCSDGSACTQTDSCQAGTCVGTNLVTCAAPDQCHSAGSCNPTSGICSNPAKADGSACTDGNACTQSDTCQAGTCIGTSPVLCAALDQCHAAGTCDPSNGACSTPVLPDGAACSDGNACTQIDSCHAGTCVGGSAIACSASDQCHVAGSCDTSTGACSNPAKSDGSSCNDGNACTQADTCQLGSCVGASPVVCAAVDQCHLAGACNAATGACSSPIKPNGSPCSDGNSCTQSDACQTGTCVGSNPVVCAALDQCHVAGTCDPSTGSCSNPAKQDGVACNDANACTTGEACTAGLCHSDSSVAIDDGNPCTADACDPLGGVSHTPVSAGTACDDSDLCNGHEQCTAIGFCGAGPAVVVDDGNPCTADSCKDGTVQHAPVSAGTSCADSNLCNGTEECNGTGSCSPGTPLVLDDGNPCTADTCDPTTGIQHIAASNGAACDDATVCNGRERCESGSCVAGTAPAIDDQNPCTTDACDAAFGVTHVAVAVGTSCADSNLCNGDEQCDAAGSCQVGAPVAVDDHNPCTLDSCVPATGVKHVPAAVGTSCADSNLCNGSEKCDAMGVCGAGVPLPVDDANPCTADACDPMLGVQHAQVPNGTSCADANACNGSEVCQSGSCAGGSAPPIDDGNPCTADSCDPATGVAHAPMAAGTNCSDGNACNGGETCSATGQCVAGQVPAVDDGNPCTEDVCDPTLGFTHFPVAAGLSCSDDNACNGDERCDAMGACLPGAAPPVDDGDPCTADSCTASSGVFHAPIPACAGGSPGTQFETRSSILGRIINPDGSAVTTFTARVFNDVLDGPARTDAVLTVKGDGSFRIRLLDFPQSVAPRTPPQHVLIQFASEAFPSLLRSAYVRPGEAVALGDLTILPRDPKVTVIGPEGGTAEDSQGTLQLQIPAGALSQATPVRLTPIPTRAQFPAPLPSNTVTMYGMEIEPSGTVLSIPATLRVKNTLNLPTTMRIPVGTVDPRFGDWTHEGMAVWDGSRFSTTISHFSPHDCNAPRIGELIEIATEGSDRNKNKSKGCGVGSSVSYANGSLGQAFDVPLHSASGHDYSLSLNYTSELSGSVAVGKGPAPGMVLPQQPFFRSFTTQRVRLACSASGGSGCGGGGGGGGGPPCTLSGTNTTIGAFALNQHLKLFNYDVDESQSFPANTKGLESSYYVPLPSDDQGNLVRSGFMPVQLISKISVGSSGTCVGGGGGFSVAASFGVGQAPLRLPLPAGGDSMDFPDYRLVVHRRGSPVGSGWSFNELATLYRTPDGVSADIVHGDGEQESFHPYPRINQVSNFNSAVSSSLTVDAQTGEVFVARADGSIQRLDPQSGALSPVASGVFSGGGSPTDFKVTYVAGARRFVLATGTALFEVDASGVSRKLANFDPGPLLRIPAVAGVGKYLFFSIDAKGAGQAVADVTTLARIDLTDPDRKSVDITPVTTGDLGLDPHGEVLAKDFQFYHPSGLAAAYDGGLYVADDRRHAVYHLAADDFGEVGPNSPVTRVLGSGLDTMVGSIGRKLPGVETAIRQPGLLSVAQDGTLYVRGDALLGGVLTYDPIEKTARWLAFDKGAPADLPGSFQQISFRDGGLAALGSDRVLFSYAGTAYLLSATLTSEDEPLRTLAFDDTGATIVNAGSDTVERFTWNDANKSEAGLTSENRRSGELIRRIAYKDADRVDYIEDPVGGRVSFAYDGSGHLSTITDPANRVTRFTIDSQGNLREVLYPSLEARRFDYDSFRMTSSTHPDGETSIYTYAPDGTLQSAQRPGGGTTTVQSGFSRGIKHDSAGLPYTESILTDDRGVQHTLSLNAQGAVFADKYVADGNAYDVENLLAGPLSDSTTGFIGTSNRLLRFAETTINGLPVGPFTQFDSLGRVIRSAQSPSDPSFRWSELFDSNQRRSKLGFSSSQVDFKYTYDAAGHLTKIADVFNGFGNQFPETGRLTTFEGFRPQDGQPTAVTSHSIKTVLGYDSFGLVSSAVDTIGRSLAATHDAAGNTLTVNDGATTLRLGYDAAGRVTSITDAENNATTLGYQTAGCSCSNGDRVTSLSTPDLMPGQKWTLSYDADGDLQLTTTPLGEQQKLFHNPQRDLIGIIDRLGRPTSFTYDQLGRQATATDPLGRVGSFSYSLPTATAWSGPTLYAQSPTDTPAPVSLTATLADGQYQVGTNGIRPGADRSHVVLYRDATFQSSQWLAMDELDRLKVETDRSSFGVPFDSPVPGPSQDANFAFPRNEFEDHSKSPFSIVSSRATLVDASHGFSGDLSYNPDFDLTQFNHAFLGRTSSLASNNFPMVVSRDSAGRLTGVALGQSSQVLASSILSYKPNGRLDHYSVTTPIPTSDFIGAACSSPDPCKAVNSPFCVVETAACPECRIPVGNNAGRCLVWFAGVESRIESFGYDDRGLTSTRVFPLSSVPAQYGYDRVGRNTTLVYPDGHQRTQAFDALGRLTSRCYDYNDGSPSHCYTAQYDAVGNPKVLTDPEMRREISYDDLDRVTEVRRYVPPNATTPAYVESYAYNALGSFSVYDGAVVDDQRPRLNGGGKASAGIPASFAGQPVTLDIGGRVTSFNGQTFQYYNVQHALQSLTVAGTRQTFVYDGLQRLSNIHQGPPNDGLPASDDTYVYADLSSSVSAVVQSQHTGAPPSVPDDVPRTRFNVGYDGTDQPLWQTNDAHRYYFELDTLGDVRHLHTDSTVGTLSVPAGDLGGYSYSAFGKTLGATEPGGIAAPTAVGSSFKWQGKRQIAPNLYYSRARIWSADLGAFLQPDEYGFLTRGGTLWSWPGQNPFRWRDPSGRDAEEWFLRNADTLQNGALAVSAAALTIATGGLAGELLGLGTLEGTLGASSAALTGAARAAASGAGAAATAGLAAVRSCGADPKIEATEIRAADLLKELNRLAATSGDPRSASQTLSEFFRANGLVDRASMLPQNISATPGISADLLLSYRAVAEEVIANNLDKSGLQAARIDLIDSALNSGAVQ